jgi:hypothetical protein
MNGPPARAIASDAASSAEHTRRHIAARLLPFVFVLYITNHLDRSSVAYAAIGMTRHLGFDDRVFGLGIGIFLVTWPCRRSRTVVLTTAAFLQYFIGYSVIFCCLLFSRADRDCQMRRSVYSARCLTLWRSSRCSSTDAIPREIEKDAGTLRPHS